MEKQLPQTPEAPDPHRRKFLGGILGGVVAGTALTLGVNKYLKQEEEINTLYKSLQGNETSFSLAHTSALDLIHEMQKENITKVKVHGTGHPNERITIVRDFLSKHLTSSVGKQYSFRDQILQGGVYTVENLEALSKKAETLVKK